MDGNELFQCYFLTRFGFQFVRFSSAADESSTGPNVDRGGRRAKDKHANILFFFFLVGGGGVRIHSLGLGLVWFGGWVGEIGKLH